MTAPSATVSDNLKRLAKDLNSDVPRSPRETIGGFVLAGRMLDKCRATLNGSNGEYHFNCPLDNIFLSFSGVNAEEFKDFVATGASDEEVGQWLQEHSKVKDRTEIVRWNNSWRYKTIDQLPEPLQLFLEDYIPEVIPQGRVVHHFFDVYDIEEGRL